MAKYTLIATAAMGIEALVAREIKSLGFEDVVVENGRVLFKADEAGIVKANLWLRTADRVKLRVGEFKATSFDELFEKTKALPWHMFIPRNGQFPVLGKSHKSKLFSVSDCQAIVKKAIVDKLKTIQNIQGMLIEDGPLFRVEVSILKDIVTLTIDTTGREGLHKRGYRVDQGEAPLKETLAASLVLLTNWNADLPFVDPFCGSGTIPIEAALIGHNIAPGSFRSFASEDWHWIGKKRWNEARQEAEDLANYDQKLEIIGSDIDHRMINVSKANADEVGLSDSIAFKQMQVKDFTTKSEYGYVVTNPPYGERLNDRPYVEKLYSDMGNVFTKLDTWSVYVLTSHEGFEQFYGKPATKKRKLFNGFIKTDYYQYFGKRPPRRIEE
ncbi:MULTISPECIES: class I SAM-dependent RNA methyltransferase [unclassified Bacillus (in: firmicutes)]|uniref:THUMP domain-containing class I SAM-dependent RNA methyltransferase n=1 Tax=unclassified Bacillus (in: firmicutes) TaxID=185979 RepID=UPI0008EF0BF0|nr:MULTISPECIES: class I SAM-dependent RNA methyltransferase [unclassified Bacillus (in: firmicutes)]PGZ91149.1 class I SAM-dependent RNA methyltransferase [Bacillus sp. AFS029533]SFC26462.1 putative N6-adenine-specific DNA methylase [Bacillus sp. UNCCL81]